MSVEWTEAEWDERCESAYVEPGLVLAVEPETDGKWFWRVDLTSAVSESPEVWTCNWADTQDEAKKAAEESAANAAPQLTKINY